MDTELRSAFNHAYSDELFAKYKRRLESELGAVPFRLAETPVFLPAALAERLTEHCRGIVAELSTSECLTNMRRAVPARFDVPKMDPLPSCVQIDFALVRDANGDLDGKIVELQAFPSLYGFQVVQTRAWNEVLQPIFGKEITPYLGIDESGYVDWLRRTVLANEDPEHVILMDIHPEEQKTVPDFVATKKVLGIDAVCLTALVREGNKLFRRKNGALVPVKRIYNRVVFDELELKQDSLVLPFAYTDDLDVHWVPHPNWYWIWSKHSLPHLKHPSVPRSTLLSDLTEWPKDLSRFVLKPLFSYAGTGVKIDVTRADLDAISRADREGWLLQEKIEYARDLVTPDGARVAVEVRVMCLRAENESVPVPAVNLARLSRGKMHGVDHNKDMKWTGSSLGLVNR